jgi:hypothetical protein
MVRKSTPVVFSFCDTLRLGLMAAYGQKRSFSIAARIANLPSEFVRYVTRRPLYESNALPGHQPRTSDGGFPVLAQVSEQTLKSISTPGKVDTNRPAFLRTARRAKRLWTRFTTTWTSRTHSRRL